MANSVRFVVAADDQASRPIRNIGDSWKATAADATGAIGDINRVTSELAQRFDESGGRLREFRRLGSELGTVGRALGGDFEVAANAASDLTNDLGSAGLAARGILDLGPSAIKAAAGVLGLGGAAATATPEVAGLGAAADTAAAGGIGTLAGVLGALALPVTAITVAVGGFIAFQNIANSDAAKTNETINKQAMAMSDLNGTIVGFTGEAAHASSATSQAAVDFDTLAGHVDESSHALKGWAGIVVETLAKNSQYFHQFTDDTKDTGAGLDNVARAAAAVRDALNGIPKSIDVDLNLNINGKQGVGSASDFAADQLGSSLGFAAPNAAGGSALASQLQSDRNKREQDAAAAERARQQAAAEAARKSATAAADAKRKAEQDARDLAQAQIAAGNDAFDRLSKAAHKYFDDLHAANLKAIDDARKKADAEIAEQKRANQQPVTDAQNALKGLQDARHLQQLQSDLEAAKTETGVDPNQQAADIQTAQNALSDFLVQNAIDQKQAQADTANAALDQQKADQDAAFDAQTTAENDRHEAQVTAFDEGLAELRKYLSKHPAEWAKYTNLVIQTLKAAGLDYKQAGVDNANAYLDGVRAAFGGVTSGGTTGKGGRQAPGGPTLSTTGIGDIAKLSSGLAYAGGGAVGDVYLDGEKVGAILDRRTGRLQGIYNPMSVSTGSGTR